jgi:hypothetical protein
MIGPEPNGIVAVFPTRFDADAALEWLEADGIDKRSVSVIGPKEAAADPPAELDHRGKHRGEIANYWARWGGVLGGTIGVGPAAIALAASTVGLGPFALALAAGIGIIAATAGAGAVGSALVGMGIHERHARVYEKALADGKFLVIVHSDDPTSLRTAQAELEKCGAELVDVHGLPLSG